ncbi:DUF7710 domain-containing protein [Mucilaginibacter lacusdianchii]|uniref:DUF7710 domain-containing protein n=1 Tax=Mucilaginibacter lacusdianchii TaxID=2684211 RepID=UPI00131CC8A0|nr:hypothetical protein [Mucilaginibacter sp. JXJ CY 39]
MTAKQQEAVWIFHGAGARFSSGVFTSLEKARHWISKHKLSGVLTEYPLDEGVYDWAIQKELFEVKSIKYQSAQFIQAFSSASQEHYHFVDGNIE